MDVDGDFAAFLDARYDEAGALAQAATAGPWKYQVFRRDEGHREWVMCGRSSPYGVMIGDAGIGWMPSTGIPDPDFIAACDPAHRLRDIALKRAILAEHAQVRADSDEEDEEGATGCRVCDWDRDCGEVRPAGRPCVTARQLGTEFSDHPDYRPGWAPEDSPG